MPTTPVASEAMKTSTPIGLAPSGRKAPSSARRSTRAVLVPEGPFSLDLARTAVMRWAPVSRFARDAARPLVLAAIADDDLRPVAFALTQGAVDGPVTVEILGTGDPDAARAQIARVLSLDHDASGLVGPDSVATRDPAVGAVLAHAHGRRPTLFPSVYEAAAWAVISPRIGQDRAATLTRRLAAEHGETLALAGETIAAFPTPQALLALDEAPGLPAEKVRRLHGVARAALDGDLDVARLRSLGPDGARAALRRVRGIGEFWSSGIWLRACGVVDESARRAARDRRPRPPPRPRPGRLRRPRHPRRRHRAARPLPDVGGLPAADGRGVTTADPTDHRPPKEIPVDDPRPTLLRATDQIAGLVGPDLPLTVPTPCAGWAVEDLLAHLVTVHRRVAHVGRGGHPLDLPHQLPQADAAAYVAALADGRREVAEVWGPDADPALLDRDVTVPWGVVPGRAAGWGYVRELAVHGWDLASALGTDDTLDAALADAVVDHVRAALPAEPRGGPIPFGPVVEVSDDAGPYARLVAWLGRDPSWAPARR